MLSCDWCAKSANDAGAFTSTFFLTLTNPMTIFSFMVIFAGCGSAGASNDYSTASLITAGALVASVITGGSVGVSTSSTTRDLHAALGSATAGLYTITAYFAIRAPKISGMKTRGPIRLHKTLAWIHGPGMILTPVLGALAYEQTRRGQEVHGIASAHAPVAYVTAVAYGAAILSVSLKF